MQFQGKCNEWPFDNRISHFFDLFMKWKGFLKVDANMARRVRLHLKML
jgi:hypothetical protein